jgi:RNA polymerase sigma factor (sigma-70 family)
MNDASEDQRLGRLIERAQLGDPAAFEEIVQGLEKPLLGFARAHGASDPDGTVNEVLLRVFRGILAFDGGPAQFRAWVYKIARNLLVDERRAASRRPDAYPTEPARLVEQRTAVDRDHLAEIDGITQLLEGVPDDQRDVLIMRIVAGLSVAEVAEALGKRPGAVRALQHRGLERLRRELTMEP